MEIYNENITDLLASRESRGKSLSVREDISGNVYVADLKEECVNCEESVSRMPIFPLVFIIIFDPIIRFYCRAKFW